jgi:hypothetical protein
MIFDKTLQVSADQALTATAASTDVIDLSSDRDVGPGNPMWWVVVAKTGLGGTSPTLAVSIETDDNSSFSSAATELTGKTLAQAAFATGAIYVLPMAFYNERFVRLKYTLGGTSPTATVDAFLTSEDPRSWVSLPDAI